MGFRDFLKTFWRAGAGDIKPTLDLHGLSVKEALKATRDFVESSTRAKVPEVRIVYGKGLGSPGGQGVLREVIPAWCAKEGQTWIASFYREVDLKGGDGSILLKLKGP